MPEPHAVHGSTSITIEFDATEPVSGRVVAASGDSSAFAGWLDLLTLLQSALPANLVDGPR